jgi:hypothetical protein
MLKYGGATRHQPPDPGRRLVRRGRAHHDLGHPEWHIGLQAMFEYVYFGDRYNNPIDVHPEFGRAVESYLGFRVGLKSQL